MLPKINHFIVICHNTDLRLIHDPTNLVSMAKVIAVALLLERSFQMVIHIEIGTCDFFTLGSYILSPKLWPRGFRYILLLMPRLSQLHSCLHFIPYRILCLVHP